LKFYSVGSGAFGSDNQFLGCFQAAIMIYACFGNYKNLFWFNAIFKFPVSLPPNLPISHVAGNQRSGFNLC
jgi:hypothetical protein